MQNISLILLFFVYTVIIKLNKNPILFWCISFMVILLLLFVREPYENIVNLDTYFWYALLGYLLGPLLTVVTYIVVFFSLPHLKIPFSFSWDLLFSVVVEEILWRHLFLDVLYNMDNSLYVNLCICIVQLLFFVVAHSNVKCLREGLEMFIFSALLVIVAFFYPGMNIGLHLGRNASCAIERRDLNE